MRVERRRAGGTRRAGLGCGAALATLFVVFLVVSVISAALFVAWPVEHNASASFLHRQSGSIRWDGSRPLTVLLVGADDTLAHSPLTSTMVLASFDSTTNRVTLLSIPGNLWVTIPGYGPATIAEAYRDGGAHLVLQVAEGVTHVPIPYYAVLGADVFRQLVDSVGGITMPGTSARQLNGAATSAFAAAARGSPDGSGRMRRDQDILLSLAHQTLQTQNFFKIPSIVNALGGSIPTNIPYDQIPRIARAILGVQTAHVTRAMLARGNGAVTPYSDSQAHVVLPDWQRIRAIAQGLFPVTWPRHGITVKVLNGSGQYGAASDLADWLRQDRIPVGGYASAQSFRYPHTLVLMRPGIGARAHRLAEVVATFLQVPVVTNVVQGSAASVTVLIGRDFQDPVQQQ